MGNALLWSILVVLVGVLATLSAVLYYLRKCHEWLTELYGVEEAQQETITRLCDGVQGLSDYTSQVQIPWVHTVLGELLQSVRAIRAAESELLHGIRALQRHHPQAATL